MKEGVMKFHLIVPVASLGCLFMAGLASAQNPYWRSGYVPAQTRPVVSPWLNLANGGNPALNYFNGVQPQRQFNNQINQLQRSVAVNQQLLSGYQVASPLGPTGHTVQFLSFQQYFNTLGGTGRGAGVAGARGAGAGVGTATTGGIGAPGIGSQRTGSRVR
jgi:hypothetical protein